MSRIEWSTKSGEIATIKEGSYFEFQLEANDTQGLPVTFTIISGTLGNGLQMFKSGLIQGVPVIEATSTDLSLTQTFTIRAANPRGTIADRTFSVTINDIASPTIIPKDVSLGTVYDGYYLDLQLYAAELSPTATLTWEKISGTLPPGVTLTSTGRLYGNIETFTSAESEASLGWNNTKWSANAWDAPTAIAQTHTYQFKVQVADGTRYDISTYTIKVQAKSSFTVDNTDINASDGTLTIDIDNKHIPFITTLPSDLPAQRQDSNFAFKIDGMDLDGDTLEYLTVVYGASEFDQGPTLEEPLLQVSAFDQYGLDQEGQSLPPGVTLNKDTGWLTGHLEKQSEDEKTYSFSVYCRKKEYPASKSAAVTFTLTVLGSRLNTIEWHTSSDLGTINNGAISEFSISAVSALGKTLNYRLTEGTRYPAEIYSSTSPGSHYDGIVEYTPVASSRLPQGLRLLPSGLIVGRTSFNYFSLDNNTTTFDKKTTSFDNTYTFSVTASDEIDGVSAATVASDKVFTIKLNNWDTKPYENIYLRALPSRAQRKLFNDIISDESIFPSELIYRKDDPWFGKAIDIKFLFAAGLGPALASSYIECMQNNHYNKVINMATIKTAVALDDNFNPKYEVVYVTISDPGTENGKSPAMVIDRSAQVKPPYNSMPFTAIYPNSLDNMKTEVVEVGYANRGAIPDWMLDQQDDGTVLGFTRAVILAYTIPGASKLIAYRLQHSNVVFNQIEFVADRYQLDHSLSQNYNITEGKFVESTETTFDRLPMVGDAFTYAGAVTYALTVPFDEINGRTLEYLARSGGIDGASFKTGQTVVFAIQENYSKPDKEDFAYVKEPFDSNGFDLLSFNSGVVPKQYDSPNDGWNLETGSYGADVYAPGVYSGISPYFDPDTTDGFNPEYYDDSKYAPSSVVPGYLDHLMNPTITNMRSGIWSVSVSADQVVTLTFVKTVNPMEYVRVTHGSSFGGSKIYYDPIIKTGHSVPEYTLLTNKLSTATNATRFDGNATRFFNNKDNYMLPGENNTFLKFPKRTVYQ